MKMCNLLNEEQRNKLIDLIKARSIVYDIKNPNYKNLSCKKKVWKDISELCQAPESACKIAWKSMRDQYRRYKRSPENKKPFRYLHKLSFLEGCTKKTKNKALFYNESTEFFADISNSSNHQINIKQESDKFHNYSEDVKKGESEFYDSNESEPEEITGDNQEIENSNNDDPMFSNFFTHNVSDEDKQDVNSGDKSAYDLCATISSLLEKHFQTEEDENDLFLKMIGKKMKSLPITVKNRLQQRFLKEVNDEIRKLNENTNCNIIE